MKCDIYNYCWICGKYSSGDRLCQDCDSTIDDFFVEDYNGNETDEH